MLRCEKSYLFLIDSICPSLAFTIIFLKLIFSDSGEIIADPKGPEHLQCFGFYHYQIEL